MATYYAIDNIILIDIYIIPKYIKENNQIYIITEIKNSDLIIKKCILFLDKEKIIKQIMINGVHPNCNPDNYIFCETPIHNTIYNNLTESKLKNIISIYNFDSCYFKPWEYIKWGKIY